MSYDKSIFKIELLASGKYKNYEYEIWNSYFFLAAYIRIPKDHPFFKVSEDVIETKISVHGGITFLGPTFWTEENFWIGWNYGHAGDYLPFIVKKKNGKKWTTRKVYREVKNVIKQLLKVLGRR